jgi:hypothetical protein
MTRADVVLLGKATSMAIKTYVLPELRSLRERADELQVQLAATTAKLAAVEAEQRRQRAELETTKVARDYSSLAR